MLERLLRRGRRGGLSREQESLLAEHLARGQRYIGALMRDVSRLGPPSHPGRSDPLVAHSGVVLRDERGKLQSLAQVDGADLRAVCFGDGEVAALERPRNTTLGFPCAVTAASPGPDGRRA